MARKQKETNWNKKEHFLILLFLLTMKSIFFFISLQNHDFQSFKAHVIWGKFSYLRYFLPSHLCFLVRRVSNYDSLPSSKIPHLHPELGPFTLPSARPPIWHLGSALVLKPQPPTWTLPHQLHCKDLERSVEEMFMLSPPNSSLLPGYCQTWSFILVTCSHSHQKPNTVLVYAIWHKS